jgi:hypothetical protein
MEAAPQSLSENEIAARSPDANPISAVNAALEFLASTGKPKFARERRHAASARVRT